MGFFTGKKKESKHLVVLAIETGNVTLSVAETEGAGGKFPYIARYGIESDRDPDLKILMQKIVASIDKAFEDVRHHAVYSFVKNAEVLVVLGSPWHISWADQIEIKKDKPFKITEEIIKEAVEGSFSGSHPDLSIVGRQIMGVRMNGYLIEKPIGKSSASLTLHAYVESAPKKVFETLRGAVFKHLPHAKTNFTTATFAAAKTIQMLDSVKDFILILPEHEVTDLVLVKSGLITENATLPFGSTALARNLFGAESASIEEALSKTARLLTNSLNATEFGKATTVLEAEKTKFIADFRNIMWKMNESLLLPGAVYVAGGSVAAHFAGEWLSKEDYSKEALTIDGFHVIPVTGKDAADKFTYDTSELKKIPFTIISAVAARNTLS